MIADLAPGRDRWAVPRLGQHRLRPDRGAAGRASPTSSATTSSRASTGWAPLSTRQLYFLGGRMNLPSGCATWSTPPSSGAPPGPTPTPTSNTEGRWSGTRPHPRCADGHRREPPHPRPAYREYGYSGYVEGAFSKAFTLGLSSLVTHADLGLTQISNPFCQRPLLRRLERAGGRPTASSLAGMSGGPWVLMAEADLLVQSAVRRRHATGEGSASSRRTVEPHPGAALHLHRRGACARIR